MSAYSDARNARARAEGYSSYSQKYRAERSGYRGNAPGYRAAVDQRATSALIKRVASGKLLGGAKTRVGTVISADIRSPKQAAQLARELARYRADRHVSVVIETTGGDVVNVGQRGGMRMDYLRDKLGDVTGPTRDDDDDPDDWDESGWDDVADLAVGGYSEGASGVAAVVTVTIS